MKIKVTRYLIEGETSRANYEYEKQSDKDAYEAYLEKYTQILMSDAYGDLLETIEVKDGEKAADEYHNNTKQVYQPKERVLSSDYRFHTGLSPHQKSKEIVEITIPELNPADMLSV